jgi:hypothetical protein
MILLSAEPNPDGESYTYSIDRLGPSPLSEDGLADPTARLQALAVSPKTAEVMEHARRDGFVPISEENDFDAEQPFSAADLARKTSELQDWQATADFQALVADVNRALGHCELWSNPGKPVREGWVIASFARRINASHARLLPETPGGVDGQIRHGDRVTDVEVTAAIEADRKPSLEKPGVEHDPVEKWEARFQHIAPQLNARISEKAEKPYAATTTLLVYLNINEWGIRQKVVLDQIERLQSRNRTRFDDLRILWKDRWF